MRHFSSRALALATRRQTQIAGWLSALIIVGVFIRIYGVGEYYYNLDELTNIYIAKGKSLDEVLRFSRFELHPALTNILRHYLFNLGESPFFLRGFSVFFGAMCIPAYFILGRQAGGTLVGCVAAGIVTFSYGMVQQSQIIRDYSFFAFAMTFPFYFGRKFIRLGQVSALCIYVATGVVCMCIQFTAIFAFFALYAVAAIYMLKNGNKRALLLWSAANAVFVPVFLYQYFTLLQNNSYSIEIAMHRIRPADVQGCLLRLIVYFIATVSYYLHCTANNGYSKSSILVFISAVIFLWNKPYRNFSFEAVLAIILGASISIISNFSYDVRIDCRRAMWILPYIILPVSIFLGFVFRLSYSYIQATYRPVSIYAGMAGFLIFGIMVSVSSNFLEDEREYLISVTGMEQFKQFLNALTPNDLIVTGKSDVMYVMPEKENIYRRLSASKSSQSYDIVQAGGAKALYSLYFSRLNNANEAGALIRNADTAGRFSNTKTVWFFHTAWYSPVVYSLTHCEGLPRRVKQFPEAPDPNFGDDTPRLTAVGIARDVLVQDVIPPTGKFHRCWKPDES